MTRAANQCYDPVSPGIDQRLMAMGAYQGGRANPVPGRGQACKPRTLCGSAGDISHFSDLPWHIKWRKSVQLVDLRQRELDDALRLWPSDQEVDVACWRLQCARNQLARVGKGWRRALHGHRLPAAASEGEKK